MSNSLTIVMTLFTPTDRHLQPTGDDTRGFRIYNSIYREYVTGLTAEEFEHMSRMPAANVFKHICDKWLVGHGEAMWSFMNTARREGMILWHGEFEDVSFDTDGSIIVEERDQEELFRDDTHFFELTKGDLVPVLRSMNISVEKINELFDDDAFLPEIADKFGDAWDWSITLTTVLTEYLKEKDGRE